MTFKDCKNAGLCGTDLCLPEFCHQFVRIQLTNADRIRAMSDEEMATDLLDMFEEICEDGVPCKEWMLGWLKQPAEGE